MTPLPKKGKKVKKGLRFYLVPFKKLASTLAWKLTSQYVRLKVCNLTDSDEKYGECYTCEKVFPFKKLYAGHLIEKIGHAAIYFDLDGIRAQCYKCNRMLSGDKDNFGQKLRKEIGEERVNNLYKKSRPSKTWNKEELKEIAEARHDDLVLRGEVSFTRE